MNLLEQPSPQSEPAEMGTLCSLLLKPELFDADLSDVREAHFWMEKHRIIFCAMRELWEAQKPLDFITVTQRLKDRAELEKAGGPAYMASLFTFVPTWMNVGEYAVILRDKFLRRQMVAAAATMLDDALNSADAAPEVIAKTLA